MIEYFHLQTLKQKRDTTDFEYFRQAYSELYRASYNLTSEIRKVQK